MLMGQKKNKVWNTRTIVKRGWFNHDVVYQYINWNRYYIN